MQKLYVIFHQYISKYQVSDFSGGWSFDRHQEAVF